MKFSASFCTFVTLLTSVLAVPTPTGNLPTRVALVPRIISNDYPGETNPSPRVDSGVKFRSQVPADDTVSIFQAIRKQDTDLKNIFERGENGMLSKGTEIWCVAGWHEGKDPGSDGSRHATFRIWANVADPAKRYFTDTYHLYPNGATSRVMHKKKGN
ncbi:hypothetical protein TWF694_011668 [Orbilia ellipsospora]|uniref:Uncharacterized protein n=1 Tax=Orbilia ellipsospora TaxID=2528407 RepID=A0AAV9XC42_9PEZI